MIPGPAWLTTTVASLKVDDVFRKPQVGPRPHPWQTAAKFKTPCDRHHVHIVDGNNNEGCWDLVAYVEVQV